MNAQTGESGIHAVTLTSTTEIPWTINALVDFGPEHYTTDPHLVSVLDEQTTQRLQVQLLELLGNGLAG